MFDIPSCKVSMSCVLRDLLVFQDSKTWEKKTYTTPISFPFEFHVILICLIASQEIPSILFKWFEWKHKFPCNIIVYNSKELLRKIIKYESSMN